MMWFAILSVALFAVHGVQSDGPLDGGNAGAQAGGAQAFANAGTQNGGAQSFARTGYYRNPYPQQRQPAKAQPTNSPVIATTPAGTGTTEYSQNPVGDAATTILNCALDSTRRMVGGTLDGVKQVVKIFLTNPPDVAIMKVLGTSLHNLSKGDLVAIKAAIANSLKDIASTVGDVAKV